MMFFSLIRRAIRGREWSAIVGFLGVVFAMCESWADELQVSYLTSLHTSGPEGWASASNPYAPPILAENGELYFVASNAIFTLPPRPSHYVRVDYLVGSEVGSIGVSDYFGALKQSALTGHFYASSQKGDSQNDSPINQKGAVFRTEYDGGFPEIITSSDGSDLHYPNGVIVLTSDDTIYGLDLGPALNGRIFKVDTQGRFSTLHTFATPPEGTFQHPNSLVLGKDGWLYGITAYARGIPFWESTPAAPETRVGSLYRINPNAPESFEILHEFTLAEGEIPWQFRQVDADSGLASFAAKEHAILAHLVEGQDGYFYGTTSVGTCYTRGDASVPNAKRPIPLCGGRYAPAYTYGSNKGDSMYWSEFPHYDGPNLYGSIYRIKPDGSDFTLLHTFSGVDGSQPRGPMVIAEDGYLYGTTMSGGLHANPLDSTYVSKTTASTVEPTYDGTLYRVKLDEIEIDAAGDVLNSGFEHLHSFKSGTDEDSDCKVPVGLSLGTDGELYGACLYGGRGYTSPNGRVWLNDQSGTIYKISLTGSNEELASVTLTASPPELTIGETAEVTWSSHNAEECVASGGFDDDGWSGELTSAGSVKVTPKAGTYYYTLTCKSQSSGRLIGEMVTLRVDAEARLEDVNKISYGNGSGAVTPFCLVLLGLLIIRRRVDV